MKSKLPKEVRFFMTELMDVYILYSSAFPTFSVHDEKKRLLLTQPAQCSILELGTNNNLIIRYLPMDKNRPADINHPKNVL